MMSTSVKASNSLSSMHVHMCMHTPKYIIVRITRCFHKTTHEYIQKSNESKYL